MDKIVAFVVKEDQTEALARLVEDNTFGAVKLVGVTDFDRYLKLIEGEIKP